MSSRVEPRRRRLATAAVVAVVVAAVAVISGCMAIGHDPGAVTVTGELATAIASTTSTSTTTAAAPTAVGTCATVTYTPASASSAQVGDLCRPSAGVVAHDTVLVLVHGGGGSAGSRDDLDAW